MSKNKLYISGDNVENDAVNIENKHEMLINQYRSALHEKNEYIKSLLKNNSQKNPIPSLKDDSMNKLIIFADAAAINEEKIMYQNAYNVINNAFWWKITKPIRVCLDIIKKIFKRKNN